MNENGYDIITKQIKMQGNRLIGEGVEVAGNTKKLQIDCGP